MTITRENYEIYFMDYLDGVLSKELQAELDAFLLANPDLQEMLEGMDEAYLQAGDETYEKKEQLKRFVTGEEFGYHAIAAAEGVMTGEEKQWVIDNLDEREFEHEVVIYSGLKVKPDVTCVFEEKSMLYRKSAVVLFMKQYAGVAAAVALGIVVAIYSTRNEEVVVKKIPVTVVKTESAALPEARIEREREVLNTPVLVKSVTKEIPPVAEVKRAVPVRSIELGERIEVPVEIMAPQPSEILISPYAKSEITMQVKEPRVRPLQAITRDLEDSDNIVSSLIDVGRNVVNRIKNREQKVEETL